MPTKRTKTVKEAESAAASFNELIDRCIDSYRTFLNDSLSLDFNKILDPKMRSLILQDLRYRQETKYIRAEYLMNEIKNLEELDSIASSMGDSGIEEDDDDWNPRGVKKRQKNKKITGADKDTLNMRFKAAEEKRDLIRALSTEGSNEVEALYLYMVAVSKEEFDAIKTIEAIENTGGEDDDDALDALVKEDTVDIPPSPNMNKVQQRGARCEVEEDAEVVLEFDNAGNIVGVH